MAVYDEIEEELGAERLREIESLVLLQTLDNLWVQHLTAMEQMRMSAGLQAYGQRNPLVMYRQESHGMFQELMDRLRNGIVRTVLNLDATIRPTRPRRGSSQRHGAKRRGGKPRRDGRKPDGIPTA